MIGVGTGTKVMVGDHTVLVKQVVHAALMVLTVDGGPDILISEQAKVNILPEVSVFAGVGGTGVGSRLAFEAPKSIKIHRIVGKNGDGGR